MRSSRCLLSLILTELWNLQSDQKRTEIDQVSNSLLPVWCTTSCLGFQMTFYLSCPLSVCKALFRVPVFPGLKSANSDFQLRLKLIYLSSVRIFNSNLKSMIQSNCFCATGSRFRSYCQNVDSVKVSWWGKAPLWKSVGPSLCCAMMSKPSDHTLDKRELRRGVCHMHKTVS